MFCTSCGTPLAETLNFCTRCGKPVQHPSAPSAPVAAAPVPPSVPSTPPPAAAASVPPPAPSTSSPASAGSRCDWCGAQVDASATACPGCGAALKHPPASTASGWIELPGRKDMTKLQIGNSSCQIEGKYVPAADMNLAAGDSVYFAHHVLLWKDPQVNITTMSLKGAWKRLFGGLPLIMTQAEGPGHIAFSQDDPGELIPIPLRAGQTVDVREHMMLVATTSVAYDWFQTGIWFKTRQGNDSETHYPIGYCMDRFSAGPTPGLLILHAGGNVFIRNLNPGQTILIKPTSLVFKDPTVQMQLYLEQPSGLFSMWRPWSNRYVWLRLTGPGRVAVKSVFESIEGEARNITNWS